jgi:hypothetical protein
MKHMIALALGLTLVTAAQADYREYREYHYHNPRPVIVERYQTASAGEVLVPLIIGGMVGAAIANANQQPQTVVVQPQPQVIVQQPQPQGFVQCPAGTMPFEQRGWIKNAYGQYVQATYIECK